MCAPSTRTSRASARSWARPARRSRPCGASDIASMRRRMILASALCGLFGFGSALGASVGIGTALLMILIGVRPLVRRIARVREAADRVGDAAGYRSVDHGDDDLGRLSADLDRTHARLRDSTERLEAGH